MGVGTALGAGVDGKGGVAGSGADTGDAAVAGALPVAWEASSCAFKRSISSRSGSMRAFSVASSSCCKDSMRVFSATVQVIVATAIAMPVTVAMGCFLRRVQPLRVPS